MISKAWVILGVGGVVWVSALTVAVVNKTSEKSKTIQEPSEGESPTAPEEKKETSDNTQSVPKADEPSTDDQAKKEEQTDSSKEDGTVQESSEQAS